MLASGLDPNLVLGSYRACALIRAAHIGSAKTVAVLLAAGADPNLFRGGMTPLIAAADAGDVRGAQQLLAHGADPEVVSSRGQRALEVARERKAEDVVALLSTVTKKHARDASGRTSPSRA